jgi:diguanylate cyclase (GGDEF)-like protein
MSGTRSISPVTRVIGLSVALTALGGAAVLVTPGGVAALRSSPWWVVPLVAVGFAAAERIVFHVEGRREAITISVSEVPTLYALVFVDLRLAIAARILGGVGAVIVGRRPPLFKVVFNAALFAFEVGAAGLAMRLMLGGTGGSVAQQLVFGMIAMVLATALGSVAVALAVAQFEGGFVENLSTEFRSTGWVFLLSSCVAGLVVAPAFLSPWLVLFSIVPLVVFWRYVQFQEGVGQELRDVRDLHGFAGRIAAEATLDDIAAIAVEHTATLLRADRCTLFVRRSVATTDPVDGLEPLIAAASHGRPIPAEVIDGDHLASVTVDGTGGRLVAPLVVDGRVIGVLAIAGRHGATDSFHDADALRLRTLADQLVGSVARGQLHQRLEHEAHHDPLTGLANRAAFEQRVAEQATGPGSVFVIICDLDRFTEVNDTLGHHAGDGLLIEVGRRLETIVAPADVVARFAGDEFGIAGRRSCADDVDAVARSASAAIERPVALGGVEFVVSVSSGVATASSGPVDVSALMRRADIAMRHAKQHHLGVEHYRTEIDRRTPARLSMLADLRGALDHGEIEVFLQPKLDLVTNTVCGAEALARWTHPTRGPISPADFIGVAEQTGLIRPLTDHIVGRACESIAALDRLGQRLTIAVNISPQDLLDELLCDRVARRLDQHGVGADRVILEITEGTLVHDSPRTRANLTRLHDSGIRLAIDDFGTGYSSLSYLRQLPVSELKIDRSFITNLVVEAQDETIVKSTVDLGHNLGLQVVAEGVETSQVADRLRDLGCDIAQGYGICRPVPFGQFVSWLSTTSFGTPTRRASDHLPW